MFVSFFEFVLPHGQVLLFLGLLAGFYMAWSIGANDVANAMGTSVGSGGLSLRNAVLIAAVMEFAGAVLVGAHVSQTVRGEIFDAAQYETMHLVLGFMGALLAAAVWLQFASFFGWPVSTTHSIIGAVTGVGILIAGPDAIRWGKISEIVLSWIISPLCGCGLSYAILLVIRRAIIDSKYPLRATYRAIPGIVFYVSFVLSLVMVWKGLKHLNLDFNLSKALFISALAGLIMAVVSWFWVRRLQARHEKERVERNIDLAEDLKEGIPFVRKEFRSSPNPKQELRPALASGSDLPAKRWEYRREFEFEKVESVFTYLLIVSACFLAFAHGANDTANAIGPLAAIVSMIREGVVTSDATVPVWMLALGGIGIVVGLATWGYKVIETIGRKITLLTPSRGFAANIGAATTIVFASRLGLPISTSHTLVGAVLGVGLARGVEHLNLRTVRDIVISWVVTIPAGAFLAVIFYLGLKAMFLS